MCVNVSSELKRKQGRYFNFTPQSVCVGLVLYSAFLQYTKTSAFLLQCIVVLAAQVSNPLYLSGNPLIPITAIFKSNYLFKSSTNTLAYAAKASFQCGITFKPRALSFKLTSFSE